MTGQDATVSVVIPTYGRREQVLNALRPLLDDPAALEVLVVVDGSTDGTLPALQAMAAREPKLVPVWQENAGAGAARQAGAVRARGSLLLLLDDDVLPGPGLASGHAAVHAAHDSEQVVVVGALSTSTSQRRTVDSVVTDTYIRDYAICTVDYERDPGTVLDHLWAGNVSLPRDAALRVGIDDPEIGHLYFEDRDLGLRLREAGLRGVWAPELVVQHEHRRSLSRYLDEARGQGTALRVLARRWPDVVPVPTPEAVAGRAPWPARLLVLQAARGGRRAALITAGVLAAARATGRARLWPLQYRLVVLLRRVGQVAGVAGPAPGRRKRPTMGESLPRRRTVPLDACALLLREPPGPGGPVVARSAARAAASGCEQVLVTGPDPRRLLPAAGYVTATWTAEPAAGGATVVAAAGSPSRPRPAGRRARWRATAVRAAAACTSAVGAARSSDGVRSVLLASRTPGPPGLVELTGGRSAYLLTGGGSVRRRHVLVVAGDSGHWVVKAGPFDQLERAEREQAVLTRLADAGLGAASPSPLGCGRWGEYSWSSESRLPGEALADVLGRRDRRRALAVLNEVGDWLGRMGSLTGSRRSSRAEDEADLGLAGEHHAAAVETQHLDAVPGVLLHGDLGSAFNILVSDGGWGIVDWETSRPAGLPLADLLPLLTGALAALQPPGSSADQAEYVLRLCAGGEVDSPWLHEQVRRYLAATGTPTAAAGSLARLALARQASLRLQHQELVAQAGEPVPDWATPWDEVARRWPDVAGLGSAWAALGGTADR